MSLFPELKSEFPILEKYTYLNTASSGLIPKQIVQWRHQHDLQFMEEASVFRDTHKAHIWEIKSAVANQFSYKKERVALVPNFSMGLNILLEGIPKGQKILLIEGDYPSINWPVEFRDFDISFVTLDEHLEDNLATAFQKEKPDVFMCSMVQYISGVLLDLDFLKQLKNQYSNTLFIGDGTQFFGTRDFNFQNSAFDIVGASAYKWMLSGYGNGFFLLKEGVEDRIFPSTIGFNSADAVFGNKNKINIVGRLEPGHQDTLNFGSLKKAIELQESIGFNAISEYLSAFSITIKERLSATGRLPSWIEKRSLHSNIFNIHGDQQLYEKLKNENIITSLRGNGIRVSFHWYNTEEDLEKLLYFISS